MNIEHMCYERMGTRTWKSGLLTEYYIYQLREFVEIDYVLGSSFSGKFGQLQNY